MEKKKKKKTRSGQNFVTSSRREIKRISGVLVKRQRRVICGSYWTVFETVIRNCCLLSFPLETTGGRTFASRRFFAPVSVSFYLTLMTNSKQCIALYVSETMRDTHTIVYKCKEIII